MPIVIKTPPALKHGAYAATAILPGESRADFEKLHRDLIAEYIPKGVHEYDIVATMARLLWRKQNLKTLRIAELARSHLEQVMPDVQTFLRPAKAKDSAKSNEPSEVEVAVQAAVDQTREEFGEAYELVELGEAATVQCLVYDLEVQERLEAMIDKCLKRLLFVRGLKSFLAPPPSSAPAKALAGPSSPA